MSQNHNKSNMYIDKPMTEGRISCIRSQNARDTIRVSEAKQIYDESHIYCRNCNQAFICAEKKEL